MSQAPLALGWLAYALLHSLLASFAVKAAVARRWPAAVPRYRLTYNLFAGASALPLLWLMHAQPGETVWSWHGAWAWLANGLALAAISGFLVSSAGYDMQEFLGLRQIRERSANLLDGGRFSLSTFHRFVRHPWYSLGLVIVWTRDMNAAMLVSAVAISTYCLVGSWFEEQKLIVMYGDTYRRYRKRVPGLIPLPWKFLTRAEAEKLQST